MRWFCTGCFLCVMMVAFFLFRVMTPLAQISTWRRKWMWRKDAWGWMITTVIWEREEEEGEGMPIVHLFPKRQHLGMLGPTMTRWRLAVTWKSFVSCVFLTSWLHFVFSYCSLFPLVVLLVFLVFLISPPPTTQIGLPLAVAVTDLAFDQSGLVPWGGGSLLSVLTTHCLQAPFPLQPHYPL